MAIEHREFLQRFDQLLASHGAQELLVHDADLALPRWTTGWDRLALTNTPGAQVLYAVHRGDGETVSELRACWDDLLAGIADRGSLSVGPFEVVVIAVYQSGIDASARRQVKRVTPSAYIPGLRPSTWVVDLQSGQVTGGSLLSKPEGLRLVEQALGPAPLPGGNLEGMRLAQQSQTDAFYRLMRGRPPLVTYALILVNVVMYAVTVLTGGPNNELTLQHLGALTYNLALHGQWWRLATTMFLHGSPEHILFNMVSLFAVGTLAERLYGSKKYLAIYLGAGLIASATSLVWASINGGLAGTAIGASGAIFGIAGALITIRFQSSEIIPRQLRQRVSSSMMPMVAISLPLSAFLSANVDSSAHVGGLLGGAALSMVLRITQGQSHAFSSGPWLHRRSG